MDMFNFNIKIKKLNLKGNNGMTVKELLAITPNNMNLRIEDETTKEFTVFDGEAYMLHGKYLEATVDWIRPIENGLCLKVRV